ncbi:MAG: hypothetical protein J6M01_05240 [Prevotella sp.]|nr:hypothetical protein [Prevotella sp.]
MPSVVLLIACDSPYGRDVNLFDGASSIIASVITVLSTTSCMGYGPF